MAQIRTLPKIEPDDQHGQKITHPSYATVAVHRVTGRTELFDSALEHQHYITLSVRKAEKFTDGSHDFIMSRDEYIEVAMSETQFARMITSLNMGSGVPCTLQHFDGKQVEQPLKEDMLNTHRDMVEDKLKGIMDRQDALGSKVRKWRDTKHRPTLKELDDLAESLECASQHFESNMRYYARCFEEHMEKVVAEAKTDVEAHALATTGRLGIIRDKMPELGFDGGAE